MKLDSEAGAAAGRPATATTHELREILEGLSRPQKSVSPKYFYDERGSKLFEAICELPEYYPTRTEIGIMRQHLPDMAEAIGPRPHVVEFGMGSGLKTRLLLEALDRPVAFAPVDISGEHLAETVEELAITFPDIEMLPVAADFTLPFEVPRPARPARRNLVYFPGSTIGNFEPETAVDLLRLIYREAGQGGCLLIGVDLKKEVAVLERAYNDSAGVTAEFNLNLLRHLNREYGANFEIGQFRHRAIYNEAEGRIEMHLVSEREQQVAVGGERFELLSGETICTEFSYKYSLEGFAELAGRAGFSVEQVWTDPQGWFSLQYLVRD